MQHNLQVSVKTAQLLQDLLSHDPFSRQPVTVSHSSCVQAALPAGASPRRPTGLRRTSAGDQQSPVGAENGDNASDSQPEEGGRTRAVLPLLISPATLPVSCPHTLMSSQHMAELQHTIIRGLNAWICVTQQAVPAKCLCEILDGAC